MGRSGAGGWCSRCLAGDRRPERRVGLRRLLCRRWKPDFILNAERRETRTSADESAERVAKSQDKANDATARDLCPLRESGPTPHESPEIPRHIRAIKLAARGLEKAAIPRGTTWAMRDLNSRPLPCERSDPGPERTQRTKTEVDSNDPDDGEPPRT